MQKGEVDAAVVVYRDLTERDPENGMAFHNLGLVLKQKDVHVEAEIALRRAAELAPTLPDPTYTLAVLLWQTNRPNDAAEAARRDDPSARRTTGRPTTCSAPCSASWATSTARLPSSARRSASSRLPPKPT